MCKSWGSVAVKTGKVSITAVKESLSPLYIFILAKKMNWTVDINLILIYMYILEKSFLLLNFFTKRKIGYLKYWLITYSDLINDQIWV